MRYQSNLSVGTNISRCARAELRSVVQFKASIGSAMMLTIEGDAMILDDADPVGPLSCPTEA